jgi:hypothetical protein
MRWTVAWFGYYEMMWRRRYEDIDDQESSDGLRYYALKQAHLWKRLGQYSKDTFDVSLPGFDAI